MATYVQFFLLDGPEVQINPDEVFSLAGVPAGLLPSTVPAGTYIQDESGARVAVQGTILATAAALSSGGPVPATLLGVDFDGAGNVLSQTPGISSVISAGGGVYTVALTSTETKGVLSVSVTDAFLVGNPGTFIFAQWTGAPGIIKIETAILQAGVAIAQDFGASLIVVLP